jgi:cytochrome c oxidase subunit 2
MRFPGMRGPLRRAATLLAVTLVALSAFSVALAYDPTGQNPGVTKEAHQMHNLYLFVLISAAVVFFAIEGLIIYAALRYRKRSDELPPQFHGSTVLEFVWTGVPIVIVLVLFVYSFIVLRDVEHPSDSGVMQVDVQAFQFQWQFTQKMSEMGPGSDPGDKRAIVTTGTAAKEPTLVIPKGEKVQFNLESNDVIHAFYVRDFLYKLDVIPGRHNHFTVTPTKAGTFQGQCAELCGLNHALMRFHVQVMERADFDKWVAEQAAKAQPAQ